MSYKAIDILGWKDDLEDWRDENDHDDRYSNPLYSIRYMH
jgi:hypothetical protein